MPVSTSVHLSQCLQWILNLRPTPTSVLDVGCGFGTWGHLCRTYLDVIDERVQPDTWRTRIDGIELFEPYVQAHQRALYDTIHVGDIRELAPRVDRYDLIITGDVIEHLDKNDGETVLEQLYDKADTALLVCIPLGDGWDHPERHGNPGELHRSVWTQEDFLPYPAAWETFEFPFGEYGVFLCLKNCSKEARVNGLAAAADRQIQAGNSPRALAHLRRAHDLSPGHRETAVLLADALIRSGATDEATAVLEHALQADPANAFGHLLLAQLLASLARRDEALAWLERLFTCPDVDGELRGKAEALRAALTR